MGLCGPCGLQEARTTGRARGLWAVAGMWRGLHMAWAVHGGALRLSPEWQSNMMKLEPEAAEVASAHLDGS